MDNSNSPNWPNNPNPNPPPAAGPTPQPVPDANSTFNPAAPPPFPSWPPAPPAQPETLSFPPPTPPVSVPPTPAPSPLDNPWNAPVQPPPFDGSSQPQPTWIPNPSTPAQPPATTPTEPAPVQSEPAPTDLSHLISNNSQPENNASTSPETLVVPPTNATPEVPTVPTETHKGIPKWVIGVGIGLLLVVAGASAYFILGIGQPKTATSLPATQSAKTTIQTPPPVATAAPQTAPAAPNSANFGQLQDSGTQQQAATSAADLLKQRQQGR